MDTDNVSAPAHANRKQRANARDLQLIGMRIGSCEIVEFIGRGGMGTVYKAIHTTLNREVAIKVLTNSNQDEKAVEWFLREAQSIAKLEHPNIIQVYDLAYAENLGTHYIVMQFVDGKSLDAMVKESPQRRLLPLEAVNYVLQTAKGLESAHKKHIIHRDIKPANIMVTSDGAVKITDFGLAKGLASSEITTVSAGLIVGTPLYMAPEQCVGSDIDVRTDIYSLGISFYFLLTGRPPFSGANSFEILEKHITEAPIPPDQLVADIPAEIVAIVMKMIAKIPSDRFQNCGELIEVLSGILEGMITMPCPICGQENLIQDTFACTECKKKNLCKTHQAPGTQLCESCAASFTGLELLHVSGVDKAQLMQTLEQVANTNKKGILSFQSGDYRLVMYIRQSDITLITQDYSFEQLMAQNRQYGPVELASILLIQVLSWEPCTWEFVEQKNTEELPTEGLNVITDISAFLHGYVSVMEILESINKPGTLVIISPMETMSVQVERTSMKIASPAPMPGNKAKALRKEEAEIIVERILSSSFKVEYRSTGIAVIEGTTIEDSLAAVYLEILYQCPNFGFFSHLVPNIRKELAIDPRQHKYQVSPSELKPLADTLQQSLRHYLKQYNILERIGIPITIAVGICASIAKGQIIYILEQSGALIKQFEEQDNTEAFDILMDQSLQFFPYNIKLLEEIATFQESRRKYEEAAALWIKCGGLREKTAELELSRHCYARAMELDPNSVDARLSLYQIAKQQQNADEMKVNGLALIPLLRRGEKFDILIQVCQQLLKCDPDLLICYKELINYFLDNNQKDQAIEYYGQMADVFKRQGNREEMIRTYQKMIKINPERHDIRARFERETGVDVPLVKAAVTATSIIKRKMQSRYLPNIILVSILAIAILAIIIREWYALNRLAFFKQQIAEEKFLQIKDEMEVFCRDLFLLGTHDTASNLYYQEIARQNQVALAKEKKALEKQIRDLYADYLPAKKYQKILEELDIIQTNIYNKPNEIRTALLEIVQKHYKETEKEWRNYLNQEQERLYEQALQAIEAKNFILAKQLLERLRLLDPTVWSSKVEECFIDIKIKESQLIAEEKIKQGEQEKLLEHGQSLVKDGELEKAINVFQKTIAILPDSKFAREASFHLQNATNSLTQAKEYFSNAERFIREQKYDDALQNLAKILQEPRWSNTELAQNITLPLLIEGEPNQKLDCFINGKMAGKLPLVYRYKPKTMVTDIEIRHPGFKIVRKEEINSSVGFPRKIILYLKRMPLWEFNTRGIIETPIRSENQLLYIGSRDNYLYCITKEGHEVWKFNTGRLAEIGGEMTLQNDQLYFSTRNGQLYILRLSGIFAEPQDQIRWSYAFPTPIYTGPTISQDKIFLGSSQGHLYFCSNFGNSYRVYQKLKISSSILAPITVIGDLAIIAAQTGEVYCLDWNKGSLVWQTKLSGNITAQPVIAGNQVYIATHPGGIFCLQLETGTKKWEWGIPGGGVRAKPYVYGEHLWVGFSKNIYALLLEDGRVTHSIPTEGGFSAPLYGYQDILWCAGEDFYIYAISLKEKKLLWKQSIPEKVFAQPYCDGTNLYIAASRTVYAYWIEDIGE